MAWPVINSAADLAALAGTSQGEQFKVLLAGALWRVERDDVARKFTAVQADDGVAARFGLSRVAIGKMVGKAARAPALPPYEPALALDDRATMLGEPAKDVTP